MWAGSPYAHLEVDAAMNNGKELEMRLPLTTSSTSVHT
jgi:hypothetical protein